MINDRKLPIENITTLYIRYKSKDVSISVLILSEYTFECLSAKYGDSYNATNYRITHINKVNHFLKVYVKNRDLMIDLREDIHIPDFLIYQRKKKIENVLNDG